MNRLPRASSALLLILLSACVVPTGPAGLAGPAGSAEAQGVAPVQAAYSSPEDFGSVDDPDNAPTNWKERMAQPYIYLEHIGDYRACGATMRNLLHVAEGKLQVTGPPFSLFFDNPGETPTDELRSRVCLPVDGPLESLPSSLRYAVLPRAIVVYARVTGAYPDVPKVYPTLFRTIDKLGWSAGVPIREVYLINPGSVANADGTTSYDELITEVQIPWGVAGS